MVCRSTYDYCECTAHERTKRQEISGLTRESCWEREAMSTDVWWRKAMDRRPLSLYARFGGRVHANMRFGGRASALCRPIGMQYERIDWMMSADGECPVFSEKSQKPHLQECWFTVVDVAAKAQLQRESQTKSSCVAIIRYE